MGRTYVEFLNFKFGGIHSKNWDLNGYTLRSDPLKPMNMTRLEIKNMGI